MSLSAAQLVSELHQELVRSVEEGLFVAEEFNRVTLQPALQRLMAVRPETRALSANERQTLLDEVLNRTLGLGALEPLLRDSTITEVMVNGRQSVFVERRGQLERVPVVFDSDEEILRIINRIVAPTGRRIDESQPLVDARLPDGSRVNAVIAPLSRIGPTLTIRRFPAEAYTVPQLVALGTVSEPLAQFLLACVATRQNIIISGATGSGKTSTLNALAGAVPASERLITIEDTTEVRLLHPHLVQMEARQANIEGAGEVTIRALLKNALRMRPDRIIVGEVRGGEALDMLQAMNTGHQGSLTTIHANSPAEALLRLETMALMAELGLPLAAIRQQIRLAIHYILQQERLPTGERRVVAVGELSPIEAEGAAGGYRLRTLFQYDKLRRRLAGAGVLPERQPLFEQAGVAVQPEWFSV